MRVDSSLKAVELDAYDNKILKELQKYARISYTQLGKAVRLGRDTAAYRVKRLEEKGVIDRYAVDTNFRIFDYDEYEILMEVLETGEDDFEEIISFLQSREEVMEIITYMDRWDVKFTVLCKRIEELDVLMTELYAKFSDRIVNEEVLEKVRDYVYGGERDDLELDEKDRKIINTLSENSRMNLVEVAERVGLSSDAVMYRMKKYEEMVKYSMHPQVNKTGNNWYTVLMNVRAFGREEESRIREYVKTHDEIITAEKFIGNWHLMITMLAEDTHEFHLKMKKFRNEFTDLIKDFKTLVAYKEKKYDWKILD